MRNFSTSIQAKTFLAGHQPVISVDTKKKELVGNFKNNGREWHPKSTPELVNVHDFIDPKLSRAVPYGVYDISNNVGWSVSALIAILPALLSMPSAAGGGPWERRATPRLPA